MSVWSVVLGMELLDLNDKFTSVSVWSIVLGMELLDDKFMSVSMWSIVLGMVLLGLNDKFMCVRVVNCSGYGAVGLKR